MDTERAREIALGIGREYVEGEYAGENGERVRKLYAIVAEVNSKLFAAIPYDVIFTAHDPYPSAAAMRAQVKQTGRIYIYTGWSGHPILSQEANNIGRAVHDVWAHCVCGCPFTFQGEYTAYLTQRRYYPEETWRLLFAEIPAQTAAYYYCGGFSYRQRAIEAPESWLSRCVGLERDYSRAAILDPI